MRLLLDEQHSPRVAAALRKAGFDVVAAAEDHTTRNIPDEDLLSLAARDGRALVTENVKDFAPLAVRWAAEGRPHSGIVFSHPERFNRAHSTYPGSLISALEEFLSTVPVRGDSWIHWV